jgi:hypothetical protein
VIGAVASNQAADKGADAQRDAANSSVGEQRRQFDLMRQDQMPWLQAGWWALPRLQETFNGNFTGFLNSPDYLATQQQGLSFMDRSAASRGNLYSGGHSADLMKYGQGLAAQQLGNYRSGLMGLAGMGQGSAQNIGAAGMGMANSISNAYTNAGNARASAYQQQGQNIAGLAQGAGNMYAYYNSNRGGWGGV